MKTRSDKVDWRIRFWRWVEYEPNTGCWLWSGAQTKGYGKISKGDYLTAHRSSWALHFGDPGGMIVCHKCDVPLCVNPDHLFLGTHQDNTQDMIQKGRQRFLEKTFSHEEAAAIAVMARGYGGVVRVAAELGVSISTVAKIRQGRYLGGVSGRRSVLSEEQIEIIRNSNQRGDGKRLAKEFGISPAYVSKIRKIGACLYE